jgi:hypothetical protein
MLVLDLENSHLEKDQHSGIGMNNEGEKDDLCKNRNMLSYVEGCDCCYCCCDITFHLCCNLLLGLVVPNENGDKATVTFPAKKKLSEKEEKKKIPHPVIFSLLSRVSLLIFFSS